MEIQRSGFSEDASSELSSLQMYREARSSSMLSRRSGEVGVGGGRTGNGGDGSAPKPELVPYVIDSYVTDDRLFMVPLCEVQRNYAQTASDVPPVILGRADALPIHLRQQRVSVPKSALAHDTSKRWHGAERVRGSRQLRAPSVSVGHASTNGWHHPRFNKERRRPKREKPSLSLRRACEDVNIMAEPNVEEHLYAGRGVRAVYPPEKIGRGFDIGDGRYGKQARNFTIETKKLLRQQHDSTAIPLYRQIAITYA